MSNIPLTDLRRYHFVQHHDTIFRILYILADTTVKGFSRYGPIEAPFYEIMGISLNDDVLLKTNIQQAISFDSKNHIISLEERYEGGYQFELVAIGSGSFKISKPIFYLHELQTAVRIIFDQELTYNY